MGRSELYWAHPLHPSWPCTPPLVRPSGAPWPLPDCLSEPQPCKPLSWVLCAARCVPASGATSPGPATSYLPSGPACSLHPGAVPISQVWKLRLKVSDTLPRPVSEQDFQGGNVMAILLRDSRTGRAGSVGTLPAAGHAGSHSPPLSVLQPQHDFPAPVAVGVSPQDWARGAAWSVWEWWASSRLRGGWDQERCPGPSPGSLTPTSPPAGAESPLSCPGLCQAAFQLHHLTEPSLWRCPWPHRQRSEDPSTPSGQPQRQVSRGTHPRGSPLNPGPSYDPAPPPQGWGGH